MSASRPQGVLYVMVIFLVLSNLALWWRDTVLSTRLAGADQQLANLRATKPDLTRPENGAVQKNPRKRPTEAEAPARRVTFLAVERGTGKPAPATPIAVFGPVPDVGAGPVIIWDSTDHSIQSDFRLIPPYFAQSERGSVSISQQVQPQQRTLEVAAEFRTGADGRAEAELRPGSYSVFVGDQVLPLQVADGDEEQEMCLEVTPSARADSRPRGGR